MSRVALSQHGPLDAGEVTAAGGPSLTTGNGRRRHARVRGRTVANLVQALEPGRDVLDSSYFRGSRWQGEEPADLLQGGLPHSTALQLFYIDSKHMPVTRAAAAEQAGDVDPGMPTKGTGKFEWKGFI